jgi:hypothetical protein
MSDSHPQPPPIPPTTSNSPASPVVAPPAAEQLAEREPIPHVFSAIEAILRQPGRLVYQLSQPGSGRLVAAMVVVSIVCSLVYGVVVGSFSMNEQLWAAPVKIACGMLLSAVVCLPSLYIFTCLSGSRAGLVEVCGLVAGLLMLMTILLVGFAPVAWLFSQSTESISWMGTLHLGFWFVATCFGLRFLVAGLARGAARSSAGVNAWIVIFVLVCLQMTTTLRPLVGRADTFLPKEKKFFLSHWGSCLKPVRDTPRPPAD